MAQKSAKARRASNAQAKVAAMRQAEEARRRRIQVSIGAVVAVLVVIAVLVGIALVGGARSGGGGPVAKGQAPPKLVNAVTGVPAATFAKVGTSNVPPPLHPIKAPPLSSGGKPEVLFVGAEYCPYCAAERWAIVASLSRFGTFDHLGKTTSSPDDTPASVPTLSFHGASYTSDYLAFSSYETQDVQRQPLEKLSGDDAKTFSKYDKPPYVSSQFAIPFLDFGGKYVLQGSSYDQRVLDGLTHQQIANAMAKPKSAVAQQVDATANYISAGICKITGGQPASVCTAAGVKAATAKIG